MIDLGKQYILEQWSEVSLYTYSVHTSQEARYVTTWKPSWLILFGETDTVYCENHMEHTGRLCGWITVCLCVMYKTNVHVPLRVAFFFLSVSSKSFPKLCLHLSSTCAVCITQ
jgi:hypothetical protein